MASLSQEEKDDIKTLLVFRANEAGKVTSVEDSGLTDIVSTLENSMYGTALLNQLIEESIIHKESLE